jgi:hypothetical protein
MQRFNDYNEFRAAVLAAGLTIRTDPPSHEGMHEDDAYEPVYAVNAQGMDVGVFSNTHDGATLIGSGALCSSPEEYDAYWHEDELDEYVLRTLEASDGAILRWQVQNPDAFKSAYDRSVIDCDHENDCYLHPLALRLDEAGGYAMFKHEDTGGGCTALVAIVDGGRFVMTTLDGGVKPDDDDPVMLGFYRGTDWAEGEMGDMHECHNVRDAMHKSQQLLDAFQEELDGTQMAMEPLCGFYIDFCERVGIKLGSADEHLHDERLTEHQRKWLAAYVELWEATERLNAMKGK